MNNQIVTVIGGDGFVGRYIVQQLLKTGAQVRVASRNPKRGWFLKAQANLGQISYIAADVTRPETLNRAVAGADTVINLVGSFAKMDAIQVAGAENVAKAARAAGVGAFLHMSAIGADATSPSNYGRTKGEGEAAVRREFPSAIIMRPSIIFGREDQFVNRFAKLIGRAPVLPVIKGDAKFQPVFVGDVARAVVSALSGGAKTAGQTFWLGGPEVLTMRALNAWIGKATGRNRFMIDVPDVAAGLMARLTGWLPLAPMTYDQWLMLQKDNIVEDGVLGLAALGIEATPLEAIAPGWLDQYKRQGRFARKDAR